KAALAASKTFNPKTNCSLNFHGERTNIRVESSIEKLTYLLVAVNACRMSADQLGLLNEYKLDGYLVQNWVDDLKARLNQVNRKQEEDRLKVLEARLHNQLSIDKKVELE